jgi:uncharacterized protein YbaR (Trm112 family)
VIDPRVLDVIVCPQCRSALDSTTDVLSLVCTNAECQLRYPVRNDIPVLLIDEASPIDQATSAD